MSRPIEGQRTGRLAIAAVSLLIAGLLLNAAGPLLLPIRDPDFFWHLRTGDWIRENRALPGEFLFTFTQQQTPREVQLFTMTSYWLSQLLLSSLHAAGGMRAIVALRWVLFVPLALLLLRRSRGDLLVRVGLLSLAVLVLGRYAPERPQFLSFLFAAALLPLLDGLRAPGTDAAARWRAAGVPPLMALWANCHGGFIVGLGFIGLFALVESAKALLDRPGRLETGRLRLLLAAGAGGVGASFLNPNGWQAFRMALPPVGSDAVVSEYQSTLEAFRYGADPWIVVYWLLLALAVAALALERRRLEPVAVGLVALTGAVSFFQVRHAAFFVVAALPVIVQALSRPAIVRVSRFGVAALAIGVGAFFVRGSVSTLRDARHGAEVNDFTFPVAAAEFIGAENLGGNIFNAYGWGGYLLWRLAPSPVFIDGRNADAALHKEYQAVLAGDRTPVEGRPYWRHRLARHGVRLVVIPFYDPFSGALYGLLDELLADPDWVPVFVSPTALVFAGNVPENRAALARNTLPRERLHRVLLGFTGQVTAALPRYAPAHVARGDLFQRLGDRAAARRSYEQALRIAPGHPVAQARAAALRSTGGRP